MSTAPLLEDEATNEGDITTRLASYDTIESERHEQAQSSRWIKPSPVWMLALTAVAAISTSGTVAPRVEIYTRTICRAYGLDHSSAECSVDPTVQAAAAQLMGVIATALGTLSMLTAAWWGSLSDSYGRIWVLGFNVGGLMVSDAIFLTVAHFWEMMPGTFWWFAVGPIIEGLVGGISVASIVMHAYISDCSDPTARSQAFSLLMGLLFLGMSVGPLLSGYIMRITGEVLPVFYVTTAIDAAVTLTTWFIMPESLSAAEMQKRRAVRARQSRSMGAGIAGSLKKFGRMFDIVSPVFVLFPRKVEDATGRRSIDWTMTILGAAYGIGTLIQASTVYQILYSIHVFGWTADVVSYWLGATHIAKAIYLTFIFPAVVKLFAWIRMRYRSSGDLSKPQHSDDPEERHAKQVSPVASLDLLLARLAVVIDLVFYALVFSTTSGLLFATFTVGMSLSAGFGPTTQSLALALYARHGGTDTGALLGALTVVSALSSHIVGPAVFSFTYAKTVATVPGAFFVVGFAALSASLGLLMLIRLRREPLGAEECRERVRVRETAAVSAE